MAVATYTKTGNKATTAAKLDKNVFGVAVESHELLKQAYVTYLANGRDNLATTKQRGEVRGGGRKPWKQKGTGRARFGSSRNPIWRGGGITFGPTGAENYSKKLHVNAKRTAIKQALSLAAADNRLIVIEDLAISEGKTAQASKLLAKIGVNGSSMIIVEAKTPELIRAFANIPRVKLTQANYLNVYDILNADQLVMTTKALAAVTDWLGGKK